MTFDVELVFSSIPKMLVGLGLTLELLFLSSFIGLVLALITLLMRISGRWFLVAPAVVYIYIFRGTPILVQIFVIYHGLPQFEFIRDGVFWPFLREPFWCCILALSLNAGAYVSEILRVGVLGVDKGLLEAAHRHQTVAAGLQQRHHQHDQGNRPGEHGHLAGHDRRGANPGGRDIRALRDLHLGGDHLHGHRLAGAEGLRPGGETNEPAPQADGGIDQGMRTGK